MLSSTGSAVEVNSKNNSSGGKNIATVIREINKKDEPLVIRDSKLRSSNQNPITIEEANNKEDDAYDEDFEYDGEYDEEDDGKAAK
jgi:hypothetical protein